MKQSEKKTNKKVKSLPRSRVKVSVVSEQEVRKKWFEKTNPRNWKKTYGIFFSTVLLGFVVLNLSYFAEKIKALIWPKVFLTYDESNLPIKNIRPKGQPDLLAIPTLNIQAPIVYATSTEEKILQENLENGVVHYMGTAEAGLAGNVYIFGHSSDFLYKKGNFKSVFARLPEIKIGDYINITDRQGYEYVYKVYETRVVDSDDVTVLSQNTEGRKILSLQTSYPIGTALKRYLVKAEIIGE
ncbi:MAG: sortase [Candidatus Doudnabacteria bacterium]|nr:sortase [Candidatus Doudnabacteria bacterium]